MNDHSRVVDTPLGPAVSLDGGRILASVIVDDPPGLTTVVRVEEMAAWYRDRLAGCSDERGRVADVLTGLLKANTALRAVLAPLLDDPWEIEDWDENGCTWRACRFCDVESDRPHAPDCAVLRADELLGR